MIGYFFAGVAFTLAMEFAALVILAFFRGRRD